MASLSGKSVIFLSASAPGGAAPYTYDVSEASSPFLKSIIEMSISRPNHRVV